MANRTEYYRSIDDADTYFANRLYSTDWVGASDADKLMAMTQAARSLDSLRFTGYKKPVYDALVADALATVATLESADATQPKQWPRDSDEATYDAPSTVQTLAAYDTNPSAGNVTVKLTTQDGSEYTTAAIAFDAVAASIQTAIDTAMASLSGYTAGDIAVTGGPLTTDAVVLTFSGSSVSGEGHGVRPVVTPDATFLIDGVLASVPATTNVAGECPDRVFYAQCEEAISLLSGKLPDQEFENLQLTSDGAASTRASLDRNRMPPKHTSHFFTSATAWKYLQAFLDDDNAIFHILRG